MVARPGDGQGYAAVPRVRHWLIAAALLAAITLVVPVIAGLV